MHASSSMQTEWANVKAHPAPHGIGSSKHGTSGVQFSVDSCFSDGHSALFHHFVDGCTIYVAHLTRKKLYSHNPLNFLFHYIPKPSIPFYSTPLHSRTFHSNHISFHFTLSILFFHSLLNFHIIPSFLILTFTLSNSSIQTMPRSASTIAPASNLFSPA